jgi:arylsulfatase
MHNVLLISLDTLRADVAFSGKFPHLEALSRHATSFTQAVSSSPLTPPSHASVFTGLHPPAHGLRHLLKEQLAEDVPTIATVLADSGYTTGAIVAGPGLNRWYGFSRSFAHYDDEIPRLPDDTDPLTVVDVKTRGSALKRAPLVTERALGWLQAHDRRAPFFLFVHFFDAHWPYEPPERFGIQTDNPYEDEIAFVDHYLGQLFEGMEVLGYSQTNTLVVAFADHGEDLAGWYGDDHTANGQHPEEEGHGCLLFDVTQRVPVWIAGPGLPRGRRVHSQVRLVDIFPTVLDVLQLPSPRTDGASLAGLIAGGEAGDRIAYSETYYREERAVADLAYSGLLPLKSLRLNARWKVIWEVGGEGVLAYDLADDPNERRPLS